MSAANIARGNALLQPERPAATAVTIAKLTPHRSGQMVAFLSVATMSGLIVHDLRLMVGRDGPWIAMPSKPQLDRDGQPRRDANGKQLYAAVVEFRDRAVADKFRDLVLEALRRQHPEALDAAGFSR